MESPQAKEAVVFSVGDQDRLSSRLGLPEPPASGCTDHSSSSCSGCRNNTVLSDTMVCKLGAFHLLLCEEGQERASFQAVDGTTEAQRLPVSLLGSGRAKTLVLWEGTEVLPTQARSANTSKGHLTSREGAVTGGETLGPWNQIAPDSNFISTSLEVGAHSSLSFGCLSS